MTAVGVVFCLATVHGGHGIHIWNLHLRPVYELLYVRDLITEYILTCADLATVVRHYWNRPQPSGIFSQAFNPPAVPSDLRSPP